MSTEAAPLRVVVFTGGRGSSVISGRLLAHSGVQITLAINGYDDGASTGEVRRFLGDALGPSDFRKNASRVALAAGSCSAALVEFLDYRLPADAGDAELAERVRTVISGSASTGQLADLWARLRPSESSMAGDRLSAFLAEWVSRGRSFKFRDCAVGNLVFAGGYLLVERQFNAAVDDYCALVGLPAGVIENVTDGTNGYLVALDVDGHVLGTEEAVVDSRREHRIADIFLIRAPLEADDVARLELAGESEARRYFAAQQPVLRLNSRLASRIDDADVIVYAPGTQHSSLFPSYLTPGLPERLASNLKAVKLLITNLQYDAEIAGSNAVSLVDRALFYLTDRGRLKWPAPSLVTHYLLNDPTTSESATPYLPLGQVDAIEDPRLVRIGSFEDGVSGRHDAAKILAPFLEAHLERAPIHRVAALLYGTDSPNKIAQSLIEMVRGGVESLPVALTVFVPAAGGLAPEFLKCLPFSVVASRDEGAAERTLRAAIAQGEFRDVVLFDSSGMYRGDDVAGLLAHLREARLEAVWGSRRLSVRDIEASYRFHYFDNPLLRGISRAGSHLLSVTYLLLYGRYIADTLSGVRVVRAADAHAVSVSLTHTLVNQYLLTRLLQRHADVLEVPVRFIALSPERVRRTSLGDGLRSLAAIVAGRWRAPVSTAPAEGPPK